MEEAKNQLKKVMKLVGKTFMAMFLPVFIVLIIVAVLLAGFSYFLDIIDGDNDERSSKAYTSSALVSGTTGISVNNDEILNNKLENKGYTDDEINELTYIEKLEILELISFQMKEEILSDVLGQDYTEEQLRNLTEEQEEQIKEAVHTAMANEILQGYGYSEQEINNMDDRQKARTIELLELGYSKQDINNMSEEDIEENLIVDAGLELFISSKITWDLEETYRERISNVIYLEKLMNAELITQYPKLNVDIIDGLNGIVKFMRVSQEEGTKELQHMDYDEFNNKVAAGDNSVLDYFAMDEEGNVIVATWKRVEVSVEGSIDSEEDPGTDIPSEEYTITTTSVNYKSMVSSYTMPFNYLWAMLVIGEDEDFVLDLADLVYESDIQISLFDKINITTETTAYTSNKQITVSADIGFDQLGVIAYENKYEEEQHSRTITVTTTTDTIEQHLTYANVWAAVYTHNYQYVDNTTSSTSSTIDYEDITNNDQFGTSDAPQEVIDCANNYINNNPIITEEEVQTGEGDTTTVERQEYANIRYIEGVTVTKWYNRQDSITTDINNEKIQEVAEQKAEPKISKDGEADSTENGNNTTEDSSETSGENFVTLFWEHNKARSYILDVSSWLFEILEINEDTANMVDLTKFLLNSALDSDRFGDISWDDLEEMFYPSSMTSFGSGLYGGTVEEKVWWAVINAGYSKEAAAGVMGNIYAESGFNAGSIEGGSGIGIGLCQWSYGRRTQLEAYAASKGVDWTDENTQIEFLIGEITPGGGANGFATYQLVTYNGYSPSDWANASTPEDAAIAFCWSFERPGVARMSVRTEAAREYYEQFKDLEIPTGSASAVVNEARGALGVPYVWGGESYTEGMDCSGLVVVCYKRALGVTLPHYTGSLMTDSHFTTVSSIDELTAGDIIVSASHVGIYTGEGTVIHEPKEGDVCREVSLEEFLAWSSDEYIYRHYTG